MDKNFLQKKKETIEMLYAVGLGDRIQSITQHMKFNKNAYGKKEPSNSRTIEALKNNNNNLGIIRGIGLSIDIDTKKGSKGVESYKIIVNDLKKLEKYKGKEKEIEEKMQPMVRTISGGFHIHLFGTKLVDLGSSIKVMNGIDLNYDNKIHFVLPPSIITQTKEYEGGEYIWTQSLQKIKKRLLQDNTELIDDIIKILERKIEEKYQESKTKRKKTNSIKHKNENRETEYKEKDIKYDKEKHQDISDLLISIPSYVDEPTWFKIISAISNELPQEQGLKTAIDWSRFSKKMFKSPEEVEKKYTRELNSGNPVKIGTIGEISNHYINNFEEEWEEQAYDLIVDGATLDIFLKRIAFAYHISYEQYMEILEKLITLEKIKENCTDIKTMADTIANYRIRKQDRDKKKYIDNKKKDNEIKRRRNEEHQENVEKAKEIINQYAYDTYVLLDEGMGKNGGWYNLKTQRIDTVDQSSHCITQNLEIDKALRIVNMNNYNDTQNKRMNMQTWLSQEQTKQLRKVRASAFLPHPDDRNKEIVDVNINGSKHQYCNTACNIHFSKPSENYTEKGLREIEIVREHFKLLFNDKQLEIIMEETIAHFVQNTGTPLGHALLIIGGQGVGKTFLQKLFRTLLNAECVSVISHDAIEDPFNSWKQTPIVFCNELKETGKNSHKVYDALKELITDDAVGLREMFRGHKTVKNTASVIACTNFENVINLEKSYNSEEMERRWCIMPSPRTPTEIATLAGFHPTIDGKKAYYTRLHNAIGDYRAFGREKARNEERPELVKYYNEYKIEDITGDATITRGKIEMIEKQNMNVSGASELEKVIENPDYMNITDTFIYRDDFTEYMYSIRRIQDKHASKMLENMGYKILSVRFRYKKESPRAYFAIRGSITVAEAEKRARDIKINRLEHKDDYQPNFNNYNGYKEKMGLEKDINGKVKMKADINDDEPPF